MAEPLYRVCWEGPDGAVRRSRSVVDADTAEAWVRYSARCGDGRHWRERVEPDEVAGVLR